MTASQEVIRFVTVDTSLMSCRLLFHLARPLLHQDHVYKTTEASQCTCNRQNIMKPATTLEQPVLIILLCFSCLNVSCGLKCWDSEPTPRIAVYLQLSGVHKAGQQVE